MKIKIVSAAFNPWEQLQTYEQTLTIPRSKWGAVANFVGTMRDYNVGDTVKSMWLEYYPGMTEKYLQTISENALAQWDILDTLIIHRVGQVQPGDTLVLVAVWAGHRAPALEACRFLIEELKSRAPFWKKETLEQGSRWVENHTAI